MASLSLGFGCIFRVLNDDDMMRRIQLYLPEDTWKALHTRSLQQRTTISELVRQAVRDKYGCSPANRRQAMQAIVGLWKNRKDLPNTETYTSRLRKGNRHRRLAS